MKKILSIVLLTIMALPVIAQERIDTLYYDKDGYGVSHKEFADYYRIAMYTDDPTMDNRYRDFHMNGQVMSTGRFISLDKRDDRNSKFIGTIVIYDEKGELSAVRNYKDGVLDGLSEEYFADGTLIQEEYVAGKPAKDYFVRSDKEGNIVKVRYSDNSIIWDSPLPSEMREDYHDGEKWHYYSKNGVTIALNTATLRDYGKYHSLNLTISNNSLVPIEFEPSCNITATSYNRKKNIDTKLKVYSCDEYLKKYDRRNAWEAILFGVSDAIAIADAGVSEQKSVSVNSKGEQTVTYTKTYDPFDQYLTYQLARMEARDYDNQVIEGREARRVGYFKRSTIYPGDVISGFAYVQRVKGNEITVNIEIEGAVFTFTWDFKK